MAKTENVTETALATKGTLRWFLEDLESPYINRLRRLLGDRMPQFAASLINLAHSSSQMQSVRPSSIVTAGIIAATLDLPVDRNLGFAWIIPYGELAQFQVGYKGFIQLALRSGHYAGMNAVPINDQALGGYDAIGDPIIFWEAIDETEPAVGYAFAWKLTTGFTKIVYWPKKKVEAHALRYSQAYKQQKKDSPWFTNFDSMGLKTVVKAGLTRWGIMSVESRLQLAIERDQSAAIDVEAQPIYPDADDTSASAEQSAGTNGNTPAPPSDLSDLTNTLTQQQPTGSAPETIAINGDAKAADPVDAARTLLTDDDAPKLTLVPDPPDQPAQQMSFDDMRTRLAAAEHIADVRALLLLWTTGANAGRSDSDKTNIRQMCDARIAEIKSANRKGKGDK